MCCIALVRSVLVLRCSSAGVEWYPYACWSCSFSLHKDTTLPQPNHTVTPTHIEPEQYNPWNKSTISRKLLKMDVLTFETCWAVNNEIIKQVTSSWSIFIQLYTKFKACLQYWSKTNFKEVLRGNYNEGSLVKVVHVFWCHLWPVHLIFRKWLLSTVWKRH